MSSNQHAIIFSHRRSGTHLTIDAIRNNFRRFDSDFVNLDAYLRPNGSCSGSDRLARRLQKGPAILKSHSPRELEEFFGYEERAKELAQRLVRTGKVIYVYRDGRDVLTSLYYYARDVRTDLASVAFSEFLKMADPLDERRSHGEMNVVEYWRHHVSEWIDAPQVLLISYESIFQNYHQAIRRLSAFLEQPMPDRIINVARRREGGRSHTFWKRLCDKIYRSYMRRVADVDFSSVHFRQGGSGGHRGVFSTADQEYFDQLAGDLMPRLGYYDHSKQRS